MNKVFEGFVFRLLIPLIVGVILYTRKCTFCISLIIWSSAFPELYVIMIPVILIFEIDRLVIQLLSYKNKSTIIKEHNSSLFYQFDDLPVNRFCSFYIPRKLYEIQQFF